LEKPDGFVVVSSGDAEAWLADLPVSRLWGVGKKTQQALAKLGVMKVKDLLSLPKKRLEDKVGVYAERLIALSRGIDYRPVVASGDAKSLSAETTFAVDIDDAVKLRGIIDALSERVGKRLRNHGYTAQTVQIKARYADFTTFTRAVTLKELTAQTQAIRDAARDLLESKLGRRGRALRLLGVAASNLSKTRETQSTLFQDRESDRRDTVDKVMDSLQDRYGTEIIHRGRGRRKER
jgi:DNA polymerase-4